MRGSSWTDERINQLRDLHGVGYPYSVIGGEMGITRNAAIGKAARLGLSVRKREGQVHAEKIQRARKRPAPADRIKSVNPEPELIDLPPDTSAFKCSILELTEESCRFPIGEPGKADFGYCGDRAIDGKSYCTRHHRLTHKANSYRGAWG